MINLYLQCSLVSPNYRWSIDAGIEMILKQQLSLELLLKLVRVFGSVIYSSRQASASVGVDIEAEQRCVCVCVLDLYQELFTFNFCDYSFILTKWAVQVWNVATSVMWSLKRSGVVYLS